MQIDLSAKSSRNLSVLKKIDNNVSAIISEASDTAIYKFDAANKKWDRFGVQGAVFVTQNIRAPFHSLIVLNKLGPDDFVLDLAVVRNAKIQDLFIMIKYATSGAPMIIGLWLRDDAEREALLKAVLSSSGEKAPQTIPAAVAVVSVTKNSTEKTSLLLQVLSSGSATATKGNGADGGDFLTDKEISAKAIAISVKTTKQTSISDDEAKAGTSFTSPSSSSFLKSMLNVSSIAHAAVPVVTPDSKRTTRSAPPPLSTAPAVIKPPPPLSASSPTKAAGVAGNTNTKFPDENGTIDSASLQLESPSGKSGRTSTGGGLVPGIVRLKNMAKKEVSDVTPATSIYTSTPPLATVSNPASITGPVSSPLSASAGAAGVVCIASSTVSSSSVVTSNASMALLAALSLTPATPIETPALPSQNSIASDVADVPNAPRRMSVSQLFQSQSKITVEVTEKVALGGRRVAVESLMQSSTKVVTPTAATQILTVSIPRENEKETAVSKSASLFNMLNLAPKDTKLSPTPIHTTPQQSNAMPISVSPSVCVPVNTAPFVPLRVDSSSSGVSPTGKLSLTPQSLSGKIERADPKTPLGVKPSQSSVPIPFPVPKVIACTPTPSPPIQIPKAPMTPVPPTPPVPALADPHTDIHSSSPSSYIISALSQYISLTAGFTSYPGAPTPTPSPTPVPVIAKVETPPAATPEVIPESSVQGPSLTPSSMKSLSPSDLTGYIRTKYRG